MNVLNKLLLNGCSREGTMWILVHWNKIGHSDSAKEQEYCKYRKNPALRFLIRRWHKKFMEIGSVLDAVRSGQLRTFAENIESVKQAFSRSPMTNWKTWWWIFFIFLVCTFAESDFVFWSSTYSRTFGESERPILFQWTRIHFMPSLKE